MTTKPKYRVSKSELVRNVDRFYTEIRGQFPKDRFKLNLEKEGK